MTVFISHFSPIILYICSLSGHGLSETQSENLASAIKSIISNLKELELSDNILRDSLLSVLSTGLGCTNLENLRSVLDVIQMLFLIWDLAL